MNKYVLKRIKRIVVSAIVMSLLSVQLIPAAGISEDMEEDEIAENMECETVVGASVADDEADTDEDSDEAPDILWGKTITGDSEHVYDMPFANCVKHACYAMAGVTYSVSANMYKTGVNKYVRFMMPEDGLLKFDIKGSDDKSAIESQYLNTYVRIANPDYKYRCMLHQQKVSEKADSFIGSYTSPEWGLAKGSEVLLKIVNHGADKNFTFSFTVTPSQVCEREYNGDLDYANTVSINTAYTGNFHYTDKVDWFTGIAAEDGRMCVKVAMDNPEQYKNSNKTWYIRAYVNNSSKVSRRSIKLKKTSQTYETPSFKVKKGDRIDFYLEEGTAPVGVNYIITLSSDIREYYVVQGQKVRLREFIPEGKNFTTTSLKKYATINNKGILKAKKEHTAKVTYNENGVKREVFFNIEKPVLDSVSVNCLQEAGDTINYSDLIYNVSAEPIRFSIKNSKVAAVDEKGTITAVAGGTAKLVVTYGTELYPKNYSFKLKVPCTTIKKRYVKVKEGKRKKLSIKNIYKKNVQISPLDATVVNGDLYLDKKEKSGKLVFEGLKAGNTDVYVKVDGVDYICNVEVLMNPKTQQ